MHAFIGADIGGGDTAPPGFFRNMVGVLAEDKRCDVGGRSISEVVSRAERFPATRPQLVQRTFQSRRKCSQHFLLEQTINQGLSLSINGFSIDDFCADRAWWRIRYSAGL